MMRNIAWIIALTVMLLGAANADAANYTASQRAAIRAMPITQRPNRPGHFYGNTVRALVRIGIIR